MAEQRQIVNETKMAGKTVRFAKFKDSGCQLFIVFTDHSYLLVDIDMGYEAGDQQLVITRRTPYEYLKEAGLLTDDEIAEHNRLEIERQAQATQREAARRRAEYERLKVEFEGKSC